MIWSGKEKKPERPADTRDDWERMKAFVGSMVEDSRELGLSEVQLIKMSVRMIDNSLAHFPPDEEEGGEFLRDIWEDEDEDAKETMIQMMIALCDPRSPLSKISWEKLARLMARTVNGFMGFMKDF